MPLSSNKRSKARKPKEEPKEVPIRVVILATERLVREVADTGGSLSGAARQAIAHHLSKALRGTVVEPYFAEEELRSVRSGPLLRYFAAVVRSREEGEALVRRLQALDEVETCYVEAGPTPPPANPADDPRNPSQGYLDAAPHGIDARWAWSRSEGEGRPVRRHGAGLDPRP